MDKGNRRERAPRSRHKNHKPTCSHHQVLHKDTKVEVVEDLVQPQTDYCLSLCVHRRFGRLIQRASFPQCPPSPLAYTLCPPLLQGSTLRLPRESFFLNWVAAHAEIRNQSELREPGTVASSALNETCTFSLPWGPGDSQKEGNERF